MANPEHLAKLMEGRVAWNRWMEERVDKDALVDLQGARLDGLDLSGFLFADIDFGGASLKDVRLNGTRMVRCNAKAAAWVGANVTDALFHTVNAENCVFDESFIQRTWFSFCLFRKASFTSAKLAGAQFIMCALNGSDVSNASLVSTSFLDSDLRDLKGVDSIDTPGLFLGIDTFFRSGGLPESLLRAANLPEEFITYATSLVGTPIEYYSCFISYSSNDNEFVRRLHNDLQAQKIKTWFAPEDLKIGDRFRSRIDESIRLHEKLVLVLSQNSINSPWVRREVEAALEREDREKKDILFPIRLDDDVMGSNEPWAGEIRRSRHIGDFRHWKSHDDYITALDRLVRDLKKEGPIIMR